MAEGKVLDESLCLKTEQTSAATLGVGGSSASLPILFIVVGEPLSEKHKDAVVKRITSGDCAFVFKLTQWLKCRPDGTIVAKLKYRPVGISLKKSAVPARRHCSCKVVVPSRP